MNNVVVMASGSSETRTHLKLLDNGGEGGRALADLIQKSHPAIILSDVGCEDGELCPSRQENIRNSLTLLP